MLELLAEARDGASWEDLERIAGGADGGKSNSFRRWVNQNKRRAPELPQTRFALAIAQYNPSPRRTSMATRVLEKVLKLHLETCECGNRKDAPDDPSCRQCVVLDGLGQSAEPYARLSA